MRQIANCYLKLAIIGLALPLYVHDLALAADPTIVIPIGPTLLLGTPGNGAVRAVPSQDRQSYCCTLINSTSIGVPGFSDLFANTGTSVATSVNRGFSGNATGPSLIDIRRKCWYETGNASAEHSVNLRLAQPAIAQPVSMRCDETTLVGGFNTSVTDFNFLEISATSETGAESESISGSLIITTTVQANEISLPFTLVFNGQTTIRRDFAVHDLIGGARDFGQIRIIHNAAPGVLKARVTQYNLVQAQPLDFAPVAQEIFVLRAK